MEPALAALLGGAETHVLAAAGVFARIGAAATLVPGLGERAISLRTRLTAALGIAVLMAPVIVANARPGPVEPATLMLTLIAEATVGLVIGLAFRFLVFALQTAGMVAAQHLSVAQMFGAGVAPEPEPTISTLLAMGGIAVALAAGLHIQLVAALVELYGVFPYGRFPDPGDLAEWSTDRFARTFAMGVGLAAPFVAIGFAYNLALGALNRAMPQLLVALVGVPALVWAGLVVLALVLPSLMTAWIAHLEQVMVAPLEGLR